MPLGLLITTIIPQAQAQAPGASPAWTPEAVLITIGFGVITVLLALVSWLGKRMLNDILNNQKEYLSRQTECRETLSNRFADKADTAEQIQKLSASVSRHQDILTRHKVLLGEKDEE